jgi:hypothetical protein
MDRSNFGDLLLKTLMCKLGNLTPFWKVKPFEACKYCIALGGFISMSMGSQRDARMCAVYICKRVNFVG